MSAYRSSGRRRHDRLRLITGRDVHDTIHEARQETSRRNRVKKKKRESEKDKKMHLSRHTGNSETGESHYTPERRFHELALV